MKEYKPILDQGDLYKDLISRIAEKEELPNRLVDKIIKFQFKEVRDFARNSNDIEIPKLGWIKISRPMCNRKVNKYKNMIQCIKRKLEKEKMPEKRVAYYMMKIGNMEREIVQLEERLKIYADRH